MTRRLFFAALGSERTTSIAVFVQRSIRTLMFDKLLTEDEGVYFEVDFSAGCTSWLPFWAERVISFDHSNFQVSSSPSPLLLRGVVACHTFVRAAREGGEGGNGRRVGYSGRICQEGAELFAARTYEIHVMAMTAESIANLGAECGC